MLKRGPWGARDVDPPDASRTDTFSARESTYHIPQPNPNLVLSPELSPDSPTDLCHHVSCHVSSFLVLAQAQYPDPTGMPRSFTIRSQRHQLSTNKSFSRFPFSLTLKRVWEKKFLGRSLSYDVRFISALYCS